MIIERVLRGIAGFLIILSLLLTYFHSKNWMIFTAFIGLNLFQSAYTNRCPMITILKKMGLKSEGDVK